MDSLMKNSIRKKSFFRKINSTYSSRNYYFFNFTIRFHNEFRPDLFLLKNKSKQKLINIFLSIQKKIADTMDGESIER